MKKPTPLTDKVKRRLTIVVVSGLAVAVTTACTLLRLARNLRPDPMCYEPPPPTDDVIIMCYEAVEPTETPMISPLDSPLPTPTPVCYTATPKPTLTPTPASSTPAPRATPTTEPASRELLRDRLLAEGRFPDEVARLLEDAS